MRTFCHRHPAKENDIFLCLVIHNSKLFLYPRIDDSSENYRNEDKKYPYLMFKEWFSLGVNYSF